MIQPPTRKKILELAQQKGNLPPLPDILVRLEAKISDPYSEVDDIAMIIETEPVLSGRLIQLSNSVFFGGGKSKVEDLSGAILRLGLKMILDLAYTLELPTMFAGSKALDQRRFWEHSLVVAIFSRAISERLLGRKSQPHVCYLAGLMHDIGIMVFSFLIPKQYSAFVTAIKKLNESLEVLEKKAFGITHPELGAFYIKQWWPIEPEVVSAVSEHHNELPARGPLTKDSQVVLLANRIASTNGFCNGIPSTVEPLSPEYLDGLGLTQDDLKSMLEEAEEGLGRASAVLYK